MVQSMAIDRTTDENGAVDKDRVDQVLLHLAEKRSMPFLELASLTDLDNSSLHKVVTHLELRGLVKVKNPGSLVDEIVTLSQDAVTRNGALPG